MGEQDRRGGSSGCAPGLTPEVLTEILAQVPDAWLLPEHGAATPEEKRAAYVDTSARGCGGTGVSSRRLCVPAPSSFDFAVVRVVPRVERGEFINAGVIVFCLERQFLGARVEVDQERLRALWPDLDVELVLRASGGIPAHLRGAAGCGADRAALAFASASTGWWRRAAR